MNKLISKIIIILLFGAKLKASEIVLKNFYNKETYKITVSESLITVANIKRLLAEEINKKGKCSVKQKMIAVLWSDERELKNSINLETNNLKLSFIIRII